MKSTNILISPEATAAGILYCHGIELNSNHKFVYITVDPELMDDEYLKKEAKDFWILAKYTQTNHETTEEPEETVPQGQRPA